MKHRLAALLVAGTLALSACSAPAPEAAPAPAPASTSATPTPAPEVDEGPPPLALKLAVAAEHPFMGYVGAVMSPENESEDEMALYKGAIGEEGGKLSVIVDLDPARDPESYPLTSLCDGLHMFNGIWSEAHGVGYSDAELIDADGDTVTSCVDRSDMPIDLSVLYGEQ
ncbi:hypothetical protein SEA_CALLINALLBARBZ_53 [Arthrobacter phage CallinAllBarbz]|uniref:Lipoprotein n=1 Tax=Arthrobacter phage CallinAllBarbz TaxID=3077790 RepID=A0AA96KEQ3_9CAUD|nr:hypothetical protein SEA_CALLINALLBARBZ_53 [Arthrobacter phage CallinAllBarbz]